MGRVFGPFTTPTLMPPVPQQVFAIAAADVGSGPTSICADDTGCDVASGFRCIDSLCARARLRFVAAAYGAPMTVLPEP
jgi:hypothetical protein